MESETSHRRKKEEIFITGLTEIALAIPADQWRSRNLRHYEVRKNNGLENPGLTYQSISIETDRRYNCGKLGMRLSTLGKAIKCLARLYRY